MTSPTHCGRRGVRPGPGSGDEGGPRPLVKTPCFLPAGEPVELPEPSVPLLPLLAASGIFLLVLLVLGVMVARRKREHSTLWFPEGFALHKDVATGHKGRREPVGQDALGMK